MPLFSEKLRAVIECILFVAGEPVTPKILAEVTGRPEDEIQEVMLELKESLQAKDRGLQLLEVAGGYQLTTKPEFSPYIEKLYRPQVVSLSQAALETLAIVAYEQPVTRSEIEQIRGVKTDSVLSTLLERGLIAEVGRRDGPGRPILYGITNEFLNHFGLNDTTGLPKLKEFEIEEQ